MVIFSNKARFLGAMLLSDSSGYAQKLTGGADAFANAAEGDIPPWGALWETHHLNDV